MITLFDTLARKKQVLRPLKPKQLGMYTCGPTVYGPSHLGHARTYIAFDALRRFLEVSGYRVRYVMNITDIHDDILTEAQRRRVSPLRLARQYTKEFISDLASVRIKKAYTYSRVTKHLQEIIRLIQKLIKAGYAYETDDGVYFRVAKFPSYGKLSGRILAQAKTGTRVRTDKYDKEGAADFALWKKERDQWLFDSPWGKGRPGWHIECSAMSTKYLGQPFDLHAGALDLLFPHHENEIAQSEAATHKKLANIFLHAGLLNINGQKMSKSLGNYITLPDFLKTYSPRLLRFFILSHHWHAPIDLTDANLAEAKTNFIKINEFTTKLQQLSPQTKINAPAKMISSAEPTLWQALEDDFNTPQALTGLYRLISQTESAIVDGNLSRVDRTALLRLLKKLDRFFVCLLPWRPVPATVKTLVKKREQLRTAKKFKQADAIRSQLQQQHYLLEDQKTQTLIVNLR